MEWVSSAHCSSSYLQETNTTHGLLSLNTHVMVKQHPHLLPLLCLMVVEMGHGLAPKKMASAAKSAAHFRIGIMHARVALCLRNCRPLSEGLWRPFLHNTILGHARIGTLFLISEEASGNGWKSVRGSPNSFAGEVSEGGIGGSCVES